MPLPIRLLPARDPQYPFLLSRIAQPPSQLYYQGDLTILQGPCLSIIGSRKMSNYGRQVLQLFVPELVRYGFTLVSGLAYGIDGEAHRLALQYGGRCAAVLGSGLEQIYPASNQHLYSQILKAGGLVLSEYANQVPPYKSNFPERNRIVAGLSLVTLIIEAGEYSGTLITARAANNEGREVGIVPGDITRPQSKGIYQLYRQGAKLVTCIEDLLNLCKIEPSQVISGPLRPALTGSLAALYDLISQGVEGIDLLIQRSGLTITEVQHVLSVLELDGYIRNHAQKWQKI